MFPGLSSCPVLGQPTPRIPPKIVTIGAGTRYDTNLRAVYNAAGHPAPALGDTIAIYIEPGAKLAASSTGAWALQLGSWPEIGVGGAVAPTLNVMVKAGVRIQGAGGQGGGPEQSGPGGAGGGAFYVGRSVNLVTTGSQIFGGGGGGGGANNPGYVWCGGGGGCGNVGGPAGTGAGLGGGTAQTAGSADAAGTGWVNFGGGSRCGNGGTYGAAGQAANGDWSGGFVAFGGGAAGYSVYGWGNCTFGTWDYTLLKFTATGVHGADIRGSIA